MLAERGIELSSVQVWRLVTQTPERLSLPVLAALCDILDVTPTDLIATRVENVAPRRIAASGGADVVDLANTIRPKRAGSPPTREPGLRQPREVRAVAHMHLRTLRPPRRQVRELVGRTYLPHLLRTGHAGPRPLPQLRNRAAASRPGRGGNRDLPGLRRHQPRLLLRPLRLRGPASGRTALRTLHPLRPAHRAPGRRHRPHPPAVDPAAPASGEPGPPEEPADLAPQPASPGPAARPRHRNSAAHTRRHPGPAELADRRLPPRPAHGQRRPASPRPPTPAVRAVARPANRHHHRHRTRPRTPALRHLAPAPQAPRQGGQEPTGHQHDAGIPSADHPGWRLPGLARRLARHAGRLHPDRSRCLARGEVRHPAPRTGIPALVHGHPSDAAADHPEPPDHQPPPEGPTPAHHRPATGPRRRQHLAESPARRLSGPAVRPARQPDRPHGHRRRRPRRPTCRTSPRRPAHPSARAGGRPRARLPPGPAR
ncbi:helix-turn-helix domain-containing protein [Streptomyces olivochromogenes]|uniref:helix-turn-helix domain-containing protein n=1 Tax=Streptomyces olivochromogenes TaxID=1963 RepID=UPI0036DF752D